MGLILGGLKSGEALERMQSTTTSKKGRDSFQNFYPKRRWNRSFGLSPGRRVKGEHTELLGCYEKCSALRE